LDRVIPSQETTMKLMVQYSVPPHIVRHSRMVSRVALALASSLAMAGRSVDLIAIERASMLHDLCKMDSLRSGRDHALMAQEVLCGMGYHFIGEIVGQHVRLKSLDLNEAMVVNYADKRVKHDKIVSLSRRFIDLMDRYGTDDYRRERILKHHQDTVRVEEIMEEYCNDLDGLDLLNLIPCDQAFYSR
jgi:uncharacterized protein